MKICCHRDPECPYAWDHRYVDYIEYEHGRQQVELGNIECDLPDDGICPWEDEEFEEADPGYHGPDIKKPYKDFYG